jgi:hypothetical protein
MLLPKTEPVFDGLRTSFLRFDGLLSELRSDRHSGYVAVEFPSYSGTILVAHGDAISATEITPGGEVQGAAALKGIVARANEPGGIVSVFRLPVDFVQLAASVGSGAPLYRDLSSAFTSLERLMKKLRDDRINGYIESIFAKPPATGLVFLRDGEIADALFEDTGAVISGTAAVDSILDESNKREAVFSVYQSAIAPAAAAPKSSDEPPASSGGAPAEVDNAVAPAEASASGVPEAQAAIITEAPTPAPVEIRPVVAIGGVLAVWSEILSRAEQVVDALSQRGTFQSALQEAFLERATVYPYLDPFAAEFSYRDGKATFDGNVPETLPEALTNSLHDAIARLAFRLKRSDIESRVRAELVEVRTRHSAIIQGFPASARALVS